MWFSKHFYTPKKKEMRKMEKNVWFEYRTLCVKCHAIAVFKNVEVGKKLYCDAGHFLGKVPEKEKLDADSAEYAEKESCGRTSDLHNM
jgi:hypothetical protein